MSNRDLEHAWHEASKEMPPHGVDAAIIAAAQKSAADRVEQPVMNRVHSGNRLAQWQSLAAAAAVAGLAFVLVQSLPRERDLELPLRRQESVPISPTAKSPSAAPSARAETDAMVPRTVAKSPNARERVAVPSKETAQGAASAPPAVTAPWTEAPASAVEESAYANRPARVDEVQGEQRKAVTPQQADGTMSTGMAAAASGTRRDPRGAAASG